MKPPEGGAVLRGHARMAPAGQAEGAAPFDAGPVWMRVLPPAVMLAIALWQITGPSYWRDEAATMAAVQRPLAELVRMMGNVDAVHGTYYMIIWVLTRLGGTGELVTRLPSALAMAGAAAAVAALGRRLVSPRAGLASGLMFAILPQVSLYAQDAREYAMITALAAAGSYVLVRALTTGGSRRGWLVSYAFCLGVMGLLNVFSLLLIGAHAVTVALAWRRAGRAGGAGGAGGRGDDRALAVGWLAAAAGAIAVASPALALGFAQRGTLGWLTTPQLVGTIVGLRRLIGPSLMLLAVCLAVAAGILLPALADRSGPARRLGLAGRPGLAGGPGLAVRPGLDGRPVLRASWPPQLLELCLPWLLLPPAVLIGVSYVSPVYTFRYVLFCVPAAALLAGAGLAALSHSAGPALAWLPAAAAFAVIAALGGPAQVALRAPNGHGNNIRAANAIIAAARRPADAVLYLGTGAKYLPAAYPSGFAELHNIGQAQTPTQAGNLIGTELPAQVVQHRLSRVHRVWVVRLGPYPHHPLRGLNFRLVRIRRASDIWMLLFERR